MKITFLQQDSFVKIAVEQLSAMLKSRGHHCDLFIESGEKQFLESAFASSPDLFAFSCTTGGESWVNGIAAEIKKQTSTPVIVGGPHPTFFPQMIENPDIDFICRGEGDMALCDLVESLHQPERIKTIPNLTK